jgi:hypothetical protein
MAQESGLNQHPTGLAGSGPHGDRMATLRDELGVQQRRPRGFSDAALRRAVRALQNIVDEPHIDEAALAEFFAVRPVRDQCFAAGIRLRDDIAKHIETSAGDLAPGLLGSANDFCRWRRRFHFKKRRAAGDRSPLLLAEGDSWFHFPLFLRDVVLQLSADHLVWPLGAAGGTLQHMVFGRPGEKEPAYLQALGEWGAQARALLFSGGGNDLIGEASDGASSIAEYVRPFEPRRTAAWHIDTAEFTRRIVLYEASFRHMIAEVAARLPNLPIIVHAYDYVIPCPFDRRDQRRPHWMARDRFFGAVFPRLGIADVGLQAAILREVVDAMNAVQRKLAGGNVAGGSFAQVFHVDLRGALDFGDWADELHPTNAGYAKVSERFRCTLREAGVG